jgi:hypothetical protein
MRSNEARHEAIMQAEDRSVRVQARISAAGRKQGSDVGGGGAERFVRSPAQWVVAPSRRVGQLTGGSTLGGRHE